MRKLGRFPSHDGSVAYDASAATPHGRRRSAWHRRPLRRVGVQAHDVDDQPRLDDARVKVQTIPFDSWLALTRKEEALASHRTGPCLGNLVGAAGFEPATPRL